jgi:Mrp family chromosome partitioning ATPase
VALTLASAAVGLSQRTAKYKATADILLTPLAPGDQTYLGLQLLRESNDPTRTAQTAAALLDSPQAAQATAARIGPSVSRSRVQADVEVEPKGQSNIVSVTATATNADLATRLANVFVEEALKARTAALREQTERLIETLRSNTTPEARQRVAQLQSLAAGNDPTMSLAQAAQRPGAPEERKAWLVMLLAGMAGFAIASGAALVAEFANRRMRDEQEIVSVFPLPILARIPKLRRRAADGSAGVLLPAPQIREAFRGLQVQLDDHNLDATAGKARVMLVTSATQDDGKTSCAIGLAMAFVDAGYRVLLIDFDVRKPDVARRLGLDGTGGLTTLVREERKRLADLVVAPVAAPELQVLLAGSDGDGTLLGARFARRAAAILNDARRLVDYVIVDTPPLGEVTDALRVMPYADDVLVVCRPGRTRSDDLELTRQLIERAHIEPRGLVVVGVGKRSNYSYGG